MEEIKKLIETTQKWRRFHREQYERGVKGACIEAAACAIRETALHEALNAVKRERSARI